MGEECHFLHVNIAFHQTLELLIVHLQSVGADEILDVFKTALQTVHFVSESFQPQLEVFDGAHLEYKLLIKNLGDEFDQFLFDSILENLPGVHFDNSYEVRLHREDGLCKHSDFIG